MPRPQRTGTGNTNLADRLNDLSSAVTNLVQNPTSAVYQSQALASLTAINGLLADDPYLSPAADPRDTTEPDATAARRR